MSIVSLSTGEPTCTVEDVRAIAAANGFTIPPGSVDETAFLLFANAFDATCEEVIKLPEYEDPRLKPVAVEGGERKFYLPGAKENPLNAWAHRTILKTATAKGPLSGRTIAVKDNVSVGGLPLGLGCSPSLLKDGKHPISPIDAIVVQRLLAAGATIKGTATCENLSMFAVSYTSHSGVVHNAWLPGYATGGSSSGCGALVSIGDVEEARRGGKDSRDYPLGEGVDVAVGGDQGGSIRLPAAYSGIYGLMPTHGLIPYTGIAALNPLIDHTGPMTRTVEDAALMLGVMAGYDGIDPRMTPESPMPDKVPKYSEDLHAWVAEKEKSGEWTTKSAAKGLRIGILKEGFEIVGLDPAVSKVVKTAAERFRSLGAEVKEVSVPLHKHGAAIWTTAARPMMPNSISGNPPDLLSHTMPHLQPNPIGQTYYDTLVHRNPAAVNILMNAAHMQRKYGPSLARKAHMHVWELRAAYDKALEEVDVLITPCNNTVCPKHPAGTAKTDDNPEGFSERIMDLFEPAIGNTLNTCSFNVTGHPAMSMPVGWGKAEGSDGRLPIVFAQAQLLRSIGAALHAVGFDSIKPTALEMFRSHTEEYLLRFATHIRSSMQAERRTRPVAQDFAMALSLTPNTATASLLQPHLKLPIPGCISYPWIPEPAPPGAPIPDFTALLQPLTTTSLPRYVPAHFPALPSKHAWVHTPVYAEREKDARKMREKATQEGLLAEQALRKLATAAKAGVLKAEKRRSSVLSGPGKVVNGKAASKRAEDRWDTFADVLKEVGDEEGEEVEDKLGGSGPNDALEDNADEAAPEGVVVNYDMDYWRHSVGGRASRV
ncbi:hypothetical protein LTR48_000600 [Friedmanniomyces endolithicus]|nr:hypothetical protein LTR29_003307 [Friedmanniomyces endolithicus]KAK1094301.1 hypothetical protein LTR48_000600 [Friedmanniomyces endolithicus]